MSHLTITQKWDSFWYSTPASSTWSSRREQCGTSREGKMQKYTGIEKNWTSGRVRQSVTQLKEVIILKNTTLPNKKLTEKVNKISNLIKQSGKKRIFRVWTICLRLLIQTAHMSFTLNMLIFLDMHLLKKCFLMLNQYITASKSDNLALEVPNYAERNISYL